MFAAGTPADNQLCWFRRVCKAVSDWVQRILAERVRHTREVVSDFVRQLRDCISPQTSVEEHGDPYPSEIVVWNY